MTKLGALKMSNHPNARIHSEHHQQQPWYTNQEQQQQQQQPLHRKQLMYERNNVQTHSVSTAKQSDFLRRHRTKLKLNYRQQQQQQQQQQQHYHHHHRHQHQSHHQRHRWHLSYRIFLVITIVLFASFNELLICVAGDSTSLIRISDDDDKTNPNQKYTDLGSTSDPLARDDSANGRNNNPAMFNLDNIGSNLEKSIAAVFNKVAYGTTTKRSIADNVFVPSLTTVPTPQLTTFRYREKEKEFDQKTGSQHHQYQQHSSYQKHSNYNNKYSLGDSEHDHALPTSAPNAEILKSNSNPTYPNPNRHHNHGERHRAHLNSTPSPSGHNLLNKGQATVPMYPAELPSYSPPARSYLTPRVPPEYPQNPFAEQPTLRGTNSESGLNSGFNINRRPIPPPSLMPGHEKIPLRPPDLVGNNNIGNDGKTKPHNGQQSKEPEHAHGTNTDSERKKVLNTPAQKSNQNRINSNQLPPNITTDNSSKSSGIHFPSISRILSGSNGMNGDIPDVLLKTVTARPTELQSESPSHEILPEKSNDDSSEKMGENDGDFSHGDENGDDDSSADEDFDSTTFNGEEPKTQPKIKQGSSTTSGQKGTSTKKTSITESPLHQSDMVYSTQIIQNLAATNTEKKVKQTSVMGNSKITNERSSLTTWTVAWNIHVYLSAILFTILAVYSIFKMIFYDKLTHLVNQSYFICLHLILIIICLARIFFLCYDAYNIHFSFHLFISELLLNLPATFLTISFSVLILFLLLRSLNHKNNRYSALMRPLTVFVGSSVHVFLCVTLHYVESYGQQQRNQQIQYQQQLLRNAEGYRGGIGNQAYIYNSPPRVLSLICQLIYIFICFSLGFFYLYIYKVLKRVLQKKSQNYIHGYQNLSYAIHITIATALLFILLAALQIYGAISISTTRPIMSSLSDNDWLQWGYQFSLRLIEIAIIALLSWVTGLKTGTTKVLQRDKVMEQHNVSGFALFPCTSSSSQEHFETDYPAICNANTNLHSYTLRTGKPIYDDTFALNSLGMENPVQNVQHHNHMHTNTVGKNNQFLKNGQDYQSNLNGPVVPQHPNESGIYDGQSTTLSKQINRTTPTFSDARGNHLNDSGTIPDHYENPNFELHSNSNNNYRKNMPPSSHSAYPQIDNCYTEPIGAEMMYNSKQAAAAAAVAAANAPPSSYDFQNFERPNYADRNLMSGPGSSATEFRASKNLKALVKSNSNNYDLQNQQLKQNNLSAGGKASHHYNPQTHSYNSFDRRGLRKSGTRTLNAPRSSQYQHQHDNYHTNNMLHRSSAGRNNSGGSKERHQARSNNFLAASIENGGNVGVGMGDNDVANDFDTVSNASSDGVRALNYNRDMVMFKAQHQHEANVDNAQNSASSGDSSTSMLVAEHGFVRFRPMDMPKDDKRAKHSDNQQIMPQSANSDKNSPAIMQRHHNRSLT